MKSPLFKQPLQRVGNCRGIDNRAIDDAVRRQGFEGKGLDPKAPSCTPEFYSFDGARPDIETNEGFCFLAKTKHSFFPKQRADKLRADSASPLSIGITPAVQQYPGREEIQYWGRRSGLDNHQKGPYYLGLPLRVSARVNCVRTENPLHRARARCSRVNSRKGC